MPAARPIAPDSVPAHVALIMDGNGRWARERDLPRREGHRAGAEAARGAVEASLEFGIRYLTLFAFSTENWHRPAPEVHELLDLFRAWLRPSRSRLPERARIRFVGARGRFDDELQHSMARIEGREVEEERLLVSVALNYGGRREIVDAARGLAARAQAGELKPSDIDENVFMAELNTAGVPDPDLVVRTAGEKRLSNFLLWQSAYSELVFLDCYWPDFGRETLKLALDDFARRERRFGAVVAT